jgi:hypothetical protein
MKKVDPREPVNRGVLDEAVEAILKGVELMFSKQEKRFDKLEAGLSKIKVELSGVKDTVNGLKSDFYETLSRRAEKLFPPTHPRLR